VDGLIANIKILLICDNKAYSSDIKLRLESLQNIPCHVWHSMSVEEALETLNKHKLRADIVILDLGLGCSLEPNDVYNEVNAAAQDIPILVITGKGQQEHDRAVLAMKSGAADSIIRGEFHDLTERIEFALIRYNIIKNTSADYVHICEERSKEQKEARNIVSMFMGGYSASDQGPEDKKRYNEHKSEAVLSKSEK
jgi:DNA-binding NtrC family response regulator